MRNPLRALIWEQWRQTAWLFLFPAVVLFTDLAATAYYRLYSQWHHNFFPATSVLLMCVTACVVVLLLSFSEWNDMRLGFSRRLYRRPVSTRLIVICTMTYRLLLAAVLFTIMFAIHMRYLRTGVYHPMNLRLQELHMFLAALLALLSFLMCCQALAWFCTARGEAVATIALFIFLVVLVYFARDLKQLYLEHGPLCLAVCLVVSYPLAIIGVTLDRRGTWQAYRTLGSLIEGVLPVRRRTAPFASAMDAQLWYEWRRAGRLLPCITFASLILLTSATLWQSFQQTLLTTLPVTAMGALFIGASATGLLMLPIFLAEQSNGVMRFLAVRPMSSTRIAWARLAAGAWSIGVTLAIIFAVLVLWWLALTPGILASVGSPEKAGFLREGLQVLSYEGFTVPALLVVPFVFGYMWVVLWMATRLNLMMSLLTFLPAFAISVLVPPKSFFAPYVIAVVVLAPSWTFYTAYSRGLLGKWSIGIIFLVWAVLSIVYVITFTRGPDIMGNLVDGVLVIMLILAPFASIPLAIHRVRHNQTGRYSLFGRA